MSSWVLVLLSSMFVDGTNISTSLTSVEFTDKYACELAKEQIESKMPLVEGICVNKDNPEKQGPHMPLQCESIYCYRKMPDEE